MDGLNLFGIFASTSGPAVVAAAVFGAFEATERAASSDAKSALTIRLRSIQLDKANALPEGVADVFNRVFGPNHFAAKCIIRSIAFSLLSMVLMFTLLWTVRPRAAYAFISDLQRSYFSFALITVWVIVSLIPDYFNLLKTRMIMRVLQRNILPSLLTPLIFLVDLIVGIIVFQVLYQFILNMISSGILCWQGRECPAFSALFYMPDSFMRCNIISAIHFRDFQSALFYAGIVPSVWLWIYIASALVTRLLLKFAGSYGVIIWFLDIEKAPIRSLGIVASVIAFTLALIGYLAGPFLGPIDEALIHFIYYKIPGSSQRFPCYL